MRTRWARFWMLPLLSARSSIIRRLQNAAQHWPAKAPRKTWLHHDAVSLFFSFLSAQHQFHCTLLCARFNRAAQHKPCPQFFQPVGIGLVNGRNNRLQIFRHEAFNIDDGFIQLDLAWRVCAKGTVP